MEQTGNSRQIGHHAALQALHPIFPGKFSHQEAAPLPFAAIEQQGPIGHLRGKPFFKGFCPLFDIQQVDPF